MLLFIQFSVSPGTSSGEGHNALYCLWHHYQTLSTIPKCVCAIPYQPIISGQDVSKINVSICLYSSEVEKCFSYFIFVHMISLFHSTISRREESHEFRRVVEKLERNPVCQRLPLRSFLILPFQRITRLKLLVQVLSFSVLFFTLTSISEICALPPPSMLECWPIVY